MQSGLFASTSILFQAFEEILNQSLWRPSKACRSQQIRLHHQLHNHKNKPNIQNKPNIRQVPPIRPIQRHSIFAITLLLNLGNLEVSPVLAQKSLAQKSQGQTRPMTVRVAQTNEQTSGRPQIMRDGLILNGQSYALPWLQWQTDRGIRIALPDGVLKKLLNIEFLSTTDSSQQPIAWFRSNSAPTAILPVQLVENDRYLDVTDWFATMGWQVQMQTSKLTLIPPAAKLTQLRQAAFSVPHSTAPGSAVLPIQNSPHDRIVLELDRPTSYQIDPQSQEWVLKLDAQVSPETIAAFQPNPSQKIAALSLKQDGTQSLLKLGIPLATRPTVTQLNDPPRLVIEVGTMTTFSHDIFWQPGIRWRQQMLTIGNTSNAQTSNLQTSNLQTSNPQTSSLQIANPDIANPQIFTVITFELDAGVSGVALRPILPNPIAIAGIVPLIQTAQQARSLVAINGGFFNRTNQLPLGLIQVDGQLRSGPILNRGVVAWDGKGAVEFDRYTLQETITLGSQSFPLTQINSAYIQAGVARYTPDWGPQYQTLSDNEIVMTVLDDRIATQTTVPTAGQMVPIPSNGYLLTFRSNRTAATTITLGTPVKLVSSSSNPRITAARYALGAGPLLIKNRQIVLDGALEKFSPAFIKERAARSAIGRLRNGNLLLVSVQPALGKGGVTLAEMAQIMEQLGAIDALNLDGGSSTTLYLGGFGGHILDRPARSSARVHNAIGIFRE